MNAYSRLEPKMKSPCLCGSGIKFKNCCKEYAKVGDALSLTHSYLDKKIYRKALYSCRLHITKYIIWHRAHTKPLDPKSEVGIKWLLMDLKAMSDLIDLLMYCYYENNIYPEFPTVLNYLSNAIESDKWKHYLTYQKACWHLFPNWSSKDEVQAKKELASIENINEIGDSKILQMYYDLFRNKLSFSQSSEIIDNIIKGSKKPDVFLQYNIAKAVEYLLIQDEQKAISTIEETIHEFEKMDIDFNKNIYANFLYAKSLSLFGLLSNKLELFPKARSIFINLLNESSLTDEIFSDIYRQIADTYDHENCFEKALQYYDFSYKSFPDDLMYALSARSLIKMNKTDEARTRLQKAYSFTLTKEARLDYAFALYELAASTKNCTDITNAIAELKNNNPKDPYYIKARDEYLIDLLTPGNLVKPDNVKTNKISKLLKVVSRYGIIQPKIFGLGVNINNIITDINDNMNKSG